MSRGRRTRGKGRSWMIRLRRLLTAKACLPHRRLRNPSWFGILQRRVIPNRSMERRKEDLRKQQEIHDAEVAELKRKLEAAIERERKSVSDTLRYVEKAFDVAIEQVKVRNPAYNLDLRGLSYEYEVIDGVVVWVDGDKKIEVPPEGLPAATGAQTDA
ncbi:hypothetical protein SESBI_11546 [Sesbania bispinosa]|nr:hypothetical protein SESBI_11546 [Sesbania bispinosa]